MVRRRRAIAVVASVTRLNCRTADFSPKLKPWERVVFGIAVCSAYGHACELWRVRGYVAVCVREVLGARAHLRHRYPHPRRLRGYLSAHSCWEVWPVEQQGLKGGRGFVV